MGDNVVTPEMDRLQAVLDEQHSLIGVMRGSGARGRRAEGLDRPRGYAFARQPFDPLDEAVAMADRKPAVLVDIPGGRGAQRVRTAIERQIDIALPQSQHLAHRRVDAPEVLGEMRHLPGQFVAGIGPWLVLIARRHEFADHQQGKGIGAANAVGGKIPTHQHVARIGQLRIVRQVERLQFVPQPRDITGAIIGGVVFDRFQRGAVERFGLAHQFPRTTRPVSLLEFDAKFGREIFWREVAARARGGVRRVVGVVDPAAGRIYVARQPFIADRPRPDRPGIVAGQDIAPVVPFHAVGQRGVVDIGDVARLIAIDEVGGRDVHPREDGLELFEIGRLVEPVIGIELAEIADPAIADRKEAVVVPDHRAVDAAIDRTPNGQRDGAELDRQGDRRRFEVAPFAADPVSAFVLAHLQPIDIDHVGRVDRIGPAEVLVMPEKREGAAGEIRARIMPAFLALDDQFVPRHAAAPGLVTVRNENGRAARFFGGHREGVGTGQGAVLAPGERVCAGLVGGALGGRFAAVCCRGCAAAIGHGYRRAVFAVERLARDQRFDDVA